MSLPHAPFFVRVSRFGSFPRATHGPIRSKVAASKPTIKIVGFFKLLYAAEAGNTRQSSRQINFALCSHGTFAPLCPVCPARCDGHSQAIS